MQLIRGFGFEDEIYRGVGGADMGGEFDNRGGDVWGSLLLGDEDIARRGGPLEAEEGVCRRLDVGGFYARGELVNVLEVAAGGAR